MVFKSIDIFGQISSGTMDLFSSFSSHVQRMPGIEINTLTGEKGFSDHTPGTTGCKSHLPSDASTSAFEARLNLLQPTNSLPYMKVVSIRSDITPVGTVWFSSLYHS